MTDDTQTDPADLRGPDTVENDSLLKIQDRLFRHRMTLKQHDHNMLTISERLTLVTIQSISSAFSLVAVASVLVVLGGVLSIGEAFAYLESTAIYLGMFTALAIGFFNFLFWVLDGFESFRKIREGPPEMPAEMRSEPEQTDD